MSCEATIITDDTETVMERSKSVVGQTPPPAAGGSRRSARRAAFGSARAFCGRGATRSVSCRADCVNLAEDRYTPALGGTTRGGTVAVSFGLRAVRKLLRG